MARFAILFWLNDPVPVIFIVYDAIEEKAYWLDVQAYFRVQEWAARAGSAETITVRIPAENKLDEAAVRLIAKTRDERAARQ
jgi:hypothetical protein